MDPIESITVYKDTTLAMLLAAQKRGWQIQYMLQSDLYSDQGVSRAKMRELRVNDDTSDWFDFGVESDKALGE